MFRRCTPFQAKNCMEWTNQSQDWVFMSTARLDMRLPVYKPEHWDKMIEMDQWSNRDDPVMTCLPLGIPRQGAPARIFHTDTDITMIYRGGSDGAGGYAEHRMIPIDGKPHNPTRAANYTYMGYTVGRWEGDTLVLDSIGFTDETWLARGGYFHCDKMRVVEKFTRTGNQMLYEVTVEDPEVLVEPWVMPARTLRIANGNTIVAERGSCTESELKEVSSQMRHRVYRHALAPFLHMLSWLETTALAVWLGASPSVWALPTVLTLHTTGLAMLVGASWVLDLRLLGISRAIPLSAFRWVFPVVAVGLVVNLVTGVLLFIKSAT